VIRRPPVHLALLVTGALAGVAAQAPIRVPSTGDLVEAAVADVERYTRAFAFLLADETSVQVVTGGDDDGRTRTLTGELFLTYLAADRRWIAVHDVAVVDGVSVPDRADLRALLGAGQARSVAARVAGRNARYNLGRVVRNFNEPTLALQVFDRDRYRQFRFSQERVTTAADGRVIATLSFRERDRPALVYSVRGGPVFATGSVELDAVSGGVRRTAIRFDDDPVEAELETTFRYDPDVDLWVPARFVEHYRFEDGDDRQSVRGETRYDNYRRFETSGRLVTPDGD
jgi:hypothetical protein